MTLVLALVLAGCAAGRGDGPSTVAEEETTAPHAEETTALQEGGNLPRPPDSTLSYGGREVKGRFGSYCTPTICVDKAMPSVSPKQGTLSVPSGSEMVFRYGGQRPPTTVEITAYTLNKRGYPVGSFHRSLKAQCSGAERAIPVELPPGEYGVEVFDRESQGEAIYYFYVRVE